MQALWCICLHSVMRMLCAASDLAMHLSFRVLTRLNISAQTSQIARASARRCHTTTGFKRSLLAFAERQEREQPWSANQGGQKCAEYLAIVKMFHACASGADHTLTCVCPTLTDRLTTVGTFTWCWSILRSLKMLGV